MLFMILARAFGGTWALREKCRGLRRGPYRTLLETIYTRANQAKGSWISVDARFSGPPFFPHGAYGIFISGAARIGTNCVIFHQVTVGSNTLVDSQSLGAPSIGDNCYLGAGAKVIGRVHIGNNVRVGANAVVYKDVPDNAVVTTGTQRTSVRENLNNHFYQFRGGQWVYFEEGGWISETDMEKRAALESRFSRRSEA